MDSDSFHRPARRTTLIAAELHRYNIDIAALSETRLADEGSLTEVGGRAFLPTLLVFMASVSQYAPLFFNDFLKPQWQLTRD